MCVNSDKEKKTDCTVEEPAHPILEGTNARRAG